MANYSTFSKPRMAHRGEIGISVRKSAWGKGIGTMLMEKLLRFAKNSANAEIVSLEVRSDNDRAKICTGNLALEPSELLKDFLK